MSIYNTEDLIDSRDIIDRIKELENQADEITEDEAEELVNLKNLEEQCAGVPDWNYGALLIHDGYFERYAKEMAFDIGAVQGDETWPCNCIDWEEAARQLQVDYTDVDFDGTTYWTRA